MTPKHNEDCQELLRLMGVPVIKAPCEAESQCAELVKGGKVFATGTEDMDALTFGSSVLYRNLTASEARKLPVKEFHLVSLFELVWGVFFLRRRSLSALHTLSEVCYRSCLKLLVLKTQTSLLASRSSYLRQASVLAESGLTMAEFIDLCILLGCDYCGESHRMAADVRDGVTIANHFFCMRRQVPSRG